MSDISHFLHLTVGGKKRHRQGIVLLAVALLERGHKVEDMTKWTTLPVRPDLVSKKRDQWVDGAHRGSRDFTYWYEIVDTWDPPRDFTKAPCDQIVRIKIDKCKTLDEIETEIERCLPP